MPATYCSLHYHLIFSTKDRLPMLTNDWRGEMHAYLGGIVKSLNGVPVATGGVEDHVHLLACLRATHCLSDVLRELKSGSSEWAHVTAGKNAFAWQPGYFGSTVSPSQIEKDSPRDSSGRAASPLATGYLLPRLRRSVAPRPAS